MKHASAETTKLARIEPVLKGIAGFVVMVTVLTTAFTAAHFGMTQIYLRFDLNLEPFVKQVINSLAGLLLLGIVGTILARVFRTTGWAQQMNMFTPLLRAMEQIARGDFSVRLETPHARHPDEPLHKLFKGVNDMAQELKQMEAMRQEFISNVSHEIQSPLTSIRGFARALQNEEISAQERSHYLSIIETESMRLSKLSDNLLALAALEADNMRFEPKPYRLDKQIRNLILACEPQWAGKNIEIEVAVTEVTINADEDLLSQVWVNLLHNSIKFTPDGGSICVALRLRANRVEFRITDTGIGIATEDQARLFERFFKADPSRNRALGGSGLGLSIAKKIIDMHKGAISVESTLGAGATFVVQLPAA